MALKLYKFLKQFIIEAFSVFRHLYTFLLIAALAFLNTKNEKKQKSQTNENHHDLLKEFSLRSSTRFGVAAYCKRKRVIFVDYHIGKTELSYQKQLSIISKTTTEQLSIISKTKSPSYNWRYV